MKVTIIPTRALSGDVTAPPSKAQTHRALVAGLLSQGTTTINNPLSCNDTEATANAVSILGAEVGRRPGVWLVGGKGKPNPPTDEIQCGESGVTLRFMIPIISLTGAAATLRALPSLLKRPLQPLIDAMEQLGVKVTVNRDSIIVEGGPPKGRVVRLPGDVSSQFISGILFAGPYLEQGLSLEITSHVESGSYLKLTIETLKLHRIAVQANMEMSLLEIPPRQRYRATEHSISGDYSSAAFFLAAAPIARSKILVRNLPKTTFEPDSAILRILSEMGVGTSSLDNGLLVHGDRMRATSSDISDCPDLGPIIATLGCYADGETKISGAARLRYKESDRLAAITEELNSLGANIIETEDGLIVHGPSQLHGGRVKAHGDHRIAMALSVAALGASNEVEIEEAECVSKSYPNFFNDLRSLGFGVIGR